MTAPKSPAVPAAPPASDPPSDPPAGAAPVTAEDVHKIVADALAGLKPAGGQPAGAPGDDVGAQLRAELSKIQDENRNGRTTAEKRIADLEKALQDATKAGGAAPGKATVEPLKKVKESGPNVAVRKITKFMWGGPGDDE